MKRTLQIVLLATVALYAGGFNLWYSSTPLGVAPVLDGKENLELARQWASDGFAAEPFYRAPLYPALLALLGRAGLPIDDLPLAARALNLILHCANALLVGLLSRRIWGSLAAAWTAGVLYCAYPVALHFSADPLDITLGISLFLAALLCVYPAQPAPRHAAARGLAGGILIALAALTRPHFIVLLPIIPLLAAFPGRRLGVAALASLGLILPLVAFALANWQLSGQWVLLPTQGSYNLWAANKPGAHGKYLEQSITVHRDGAHRNPTRVEAELLFEREFGRPARSASELNAHWQQQWLESIRRSPLLHLQQAAAKVYFLVNNTEQYNNKTYAFHKTRSPWLRHNPLCWSLLLLCGGLALLLGRARAPRWPLIATALIYAAGVLIFFVSARFRLPIVPLLAVASGGLATISISSQMPIRLQTIRSTHVLGAIAIIALTAVSLTSFLGVSDQRTFVQDHILIAQAAAEIGDEDVAYSHSARALELSADNPAAIELFVLSWFNRVITADLPLPSDSETRSMLLLTERLESPPPAIRAVIGCCLHRLGETAEATAIWLELVSSGDDGNPLPALALVLSGNRRELSQAVPGITLNPALLSSGEAAVLTRFLQP